MNRLTEQVKLVKCVEALGLRGPSKKLASLSISIYKYYVPQALAVAAAKLKTAYLNLLPPLLNLLLDL